METFKRSGIGEVTERMAFDATRTERLCEATDIPVAPSPIIDPKALQRIAKELRAINDGLARVDDLVKKQRR